MIPAENLVSAAGGTPTRIAVEVGRVLVQLRLVAVLAALSASLFFVPTTTCRQNAMVRISTP